MRSRAWLFRSSLLLAGLAVLVPSSNLLLAPGVPLTSPVSLVAAVMVACMAFGDVRRRARLIHERLSVVGKVALAMIGVGAVVGKVALLISGSHSGFVGCYRSQPSSNEAKCERSFANPFVRFGATRVDRELAFGSRSGDGPATSLAASNWELDFFNSNRFNFYSWEPAQPSRDTLPFSATWTATVENEKPRVAVVDYVGRGEVVVDGQRFDLAPRYDGEGRQEVLVPPGRSSITIDFGFDTLRLAGEALDRPYAELRLRYADGTPVETAGPNGAVRAVVVVVDGLVAVLLALPLAAIVFSLGYLLALVAAPALLWWAGAPYFGGLRAALLVLLAGVAVKLRRRGAASAKVLACLALAVVAIEMVHANQGYAGLEQVVYRGGGSDFLTYESQAHALLSGSLQGEEAVFVYSPAFRYLLAVGHALFGSGDMALTAVALSALVGLVLWFGVHMLDRPLAVLAKVRSLREPVSAEVVSGALAVLTVVCVILLVASTTMTGLVRAPVSEYPTWIVLAAAVLLICRGRGLRCILVLSSLLASATVTRFDQSLGLGLLLVVGVVVMLRQTRPTGGRRWAAFLAATLFASIVLLPALHNVVYGHRFVVLPETPRLPVNFPLPLPRAVRACCDTDARAVLVSQLRGVTVTPPDLPRAGPLSFYGMVRALQALWLLALVLWVSWWRHRPSVHAGALMVAPLLFLVPHVFIQVYGYYPRHVVAGYLAMGLGTSLFLAELCQRLRPEDYLRQEANSANSPV